jgi:hypothetical protein
MNGRQIFRLRPGRKKIFPFPDTFTQKTAGSLPVSEKQSYFLIGGSAFSQLLDPNIPKRPDPAADRLPSPSPFQASAGGQNFKASGRPDKKYAAEILKNLSKKSLNLYTDSLRYSAKL